MTTPHTKLFIPGPVEVTPEAFAATTQPMIGHRSGDFKNLYAALQPKLQKLFYTTNPVYLLTASAWGGMEAAVRNTVRPGKKVLNVGNGAFGDKWHSVSQANGVEATQLKFEWGTPIDPEAVRAELAKGGYDAITFVHSETSVGLENPIAEIMAVVREFPEVISIMDTISSFSTQKIPADELGVDIMISGLQKALALPPGLCLLCTAPRVLERAAEVPHRGYYFDLLELDKNHQKNLTPTTPAVSLVQALDWRCDQIAAEGIENRYERHRLINQKVRDWCKANGFELFPPEANAAHGLVCAANTRNVDLEKLNSELKKRFNMMINIGYGDLKGKTFRIATMGDETSETIDELLGNLDAVLADM